MSNENKGAQHQPSARERLKPVELLVLSLVMAVFVGLIVLMSTRDWTLTAVFFGIGFIVALIGVALFGLTKPDSGPASSSNDEDRGDPDGATRP